MKLNLDYTNDPRWDQMSEIHKKTLPIPNVFVSILYQYQDQIPNLSDINFAVETGTHDARTSIFLAEHFDIAFTSELYPDRNPYDGKSYRSHYEEINLRHGNLTFLFGSSEEALKLILEEIPNERFLILLDAHSGPYTPLRGELDSIKNYSNRKDHVIIIDDCKHLGQGTFPDLSEFETLLREINPEYNIINTQEGNQIYLVY
jgi:hypothetical protein